MRYGRRFMRGLLVCLLAILCGCAPYFERPQCAEPIAYKQSNNWSITLRNITAKLLWQISDPHAKGLGGFGGLGSYNAGLIASEDHVVYFLPQSNEGCYTESQIIAFDMTTGEEAWRLLEPPPNELTTSIASVFRSIATIDDGYALISMDSTLLKITEAGDIAWVQAQFPSRSITSVSDMHEDILYLPSNAIVYAVDINNGSIVNKITLSKVEAYYSDIAVLGIDRFTLQVMDTQSFSERFKIPLWSQIETGVFNTSSNPFIDRYQNILLVYDYSYPQSGEMSHIMAYDLNSGDKLWEWQKALNSYPLIFDGVLAIFADNQLNFYDLTDGQLTGWITFHQQSKSESTPIEEMWLAGHNNHLIVNFQETYEILSLEVYPN